MLKRVDKFQSWNHGLILPFYVEKYDHQASDQFDQYKKKYNCYKVFYEVIDVERVAPVENFLGQLCG